MQLHDHNNIERLYLKTLGTGVKTIAIMSCEKNAGVTTLAMALAQRHLLAKNSVLYVELNSVRPSMSALCPFDSVELELEAQDDNQTPNKPQHLTQPMLLQSRDNDAVITGVLAPTDKSDIIALRNTETLHRHIQAISEEFDTVIIDCAPLCGSMGDDSSAAVPADIVASVCDASILIVQGGVTKAPTLKRALALLATHDKKPTAIAINQQYNPTLGQELIREALRIHKYLPRLSGWLCQKIKSSLLMHPL